MKASQGSDIRRDMFKFLTPIDFQKINFTRLCPEPAEELPELVEGKQGGDHTYPYISDR